VAADVQVGLRRELEARERRVFAEFARRDLIDRHAGVRRFTDLYTLEPCLLGRLVHAARAILLAAIAQARDHGNAIAERLEGFQHLRDLEVAALAFRRPRVDVRPLTRERAVREIEEPHALARLRGALREGNACGNHGIEQRQRDRCGTATQHRASRNVLLRQ
jgi:hypothetical protein